MAKFFETLRLKGRGRRKLIRLKISLNADLQIATAEEESYLGFRTGDFGVGGMGIKMKEEELQRVWVEDRKRINAIIRIPPDYQKEVRVAARLAWTREEEEGIITGWEFTRFIGDAKKRINQYVDAQQQ